MISKDRFSNLHPFFNSKDEFFESARIWAKNLDFYLTTDKSETDRLVLICVRGGRQRLNDQASRTIKCDCPFKITCRKQKDQRWKVSLTNAFHNHPPISNISVPQPRKLTETQKYEVLRLHESLVAPRQIVSLLGMSTVVKTKNIYNIIASGKKRKLEGRSPLHTLLDAFQLENCYFELNEEEGHINRLSFAFPQQIEMFRKNRYVLIADCTYKTNRYKMPLMHFIGLSNVSKSFSVAFCFLKSETKEDYLWALHAFSNCFGMHPEVFVTDQEDALLNAACEVFPSTSHFLCI